MLPPLVLTLLRSKTVQKYGAIVVAIVLVISSTYFKGRHDVQVKWDKETAIMEAKIKDLESKAQLINTVVEVKVVEVLKEVKVKGDTITKYVYINLPGDVGPPTPFVDGDQIKVAVYRLPKNFIALHDFAALNIVPAQDDPAIKDLEISEEQLNKVLGTVTANYATCHAITAQRDGWQLWYREQRAANEAARKGK